MEPLNNRHLGAKGDPLFRDEKILPRSCSKTTEFVLYREVKCIVSFTQNMFLERFYCSNKDGTITSSLGILPNQPHGSTKLIYTVLLISAVSFLCDIIPITMWLSYAMPLPELWLTDGIMF